jgi:hypothetical protein
MREAELQDPREMYPKPPYKRQSQPWPGLAGKMDPRPDHGETSYRFDPMRTCARWIIAERRRISKAAAQFPKWRGFSFVI